MKFYAKLVAILLACVGLFVYANTIFYEFVGTTSSQPRIYAIEKAKSVDLDDLGREIEEESNQLAQQKFRVSPQLLNNH